MKVSLDEPVFEWKCRGWNCLLFWMKWFWTKVFLDESVFGWKCFWMKVFLDEFFFCNLDQSVPNRRWRFSLARHGASGALRNGGAKTAPLLERFPLGAATTVTPAWTGPWLRLDLGPARYRESWFNRCFQPIVAVSLDVPGARATAVGLRVAPSRLVFPARCCCGGFWAATHFPPPRSPSSMSLDSFGVSVDCWANRHNCVTLAALTFMRECLCFTTMRNTNFRWWCWSSSFLLLSGLPTKAEIFKGSLRLVCQASNLRFLEWSKSFFEWRNDKSRDAQQQGDGKHQRTLLIMRASDLWVLVSESLVRLDMRVASPRSAQPFPTGLEEFWCAGPDQARRARCLSSQFRMARVLHTCACDACTSKFVSEECSDVRLWQVAQALFRLRTVSDMRLWPMHKRVPAGTVHALHQGCVRFPRVTPENLSRQHLSENQPKNAQKAAGARQHLSDDIDVDQCTDCTVPLLYVVGFQVGRLYAQCWKCFNVWPFLGRMRREAVSRMNREAWEWRCIITRPSKASPWWMDPSSYRCLKTPEIHIAWVLANLRQRQHCVDCRLGHHMCRFVDPSTWAVCMPIVGRNLVCGLSSNT